MTSQAENKQNNQSLRWTYSQILRGKANSILAIELIIVVVLVVIGMLLSNVSLPFGTVCAKLVANLLALKADAFAREMCQDIALCVPLMIVLWPIIGAVLLAFCNARARSIKPTPEAIAAHNAAAQRAWTWPMSIILGVFDFFVAFSLCEIVIGLLSAVLSTVAIKMFTAVFTIVCLVFAERRVTVVSRYVAGRWQGNFTTTCALLDGKLDEELPEKYRNDLGRAKAATVITRGIVRTPHWAAIVVEGIGVRTKVKLFSGFLNSTIHGVLTAISFGIAATAANSLGNVSGQFAAGNQKEYTDSLRRPYDKKPHLFIEGIVVIVCVAIVVYSLVTGEVAV